VPEKVHPFVAVVVIEYKPAEVTFTGIETVFELVNGVPCVYTPANVAVAQSNTPTAGGGAAKKVIGKLQLLVPKLTENETVPALTGVPLPVSTTFWGPKEKVPEPEKAHPFVAVVVIEYEPAVVTLTGIVTVFAVVNGILCWNTPARTAPVQSIVPTATDPVLVVVVIEKEQPEVPGVKLFVPAATGVPEPVNMMTCVPVMVNVPEPLNEIPLLVPVETV